MYETWTKFFIDILDELAPVTVVRTKMEMPLGSVDGQVSTTIHCVLDMLDDDSPWCDLEVHKVDGKQDMLHAHYQVHIPNLNRVTDNELIANIRAVGGSNVKSIMLISPVGETAKETYAI